MLQNFMSNTGDSNWFMIFEHSYIMCVDTNYEVDKLIYMYYIIHGIVFNSTFINCCASKYFIINYNFISINIFGKQTQWVSLQ